MKFMKFAAVGGLNTLIDLSILNFLFFAFPVEVGWWYIACKTIAFLAAVINSYFLNKVWVFKRRDTPIYREGALFLLVSTIGLIINVAVSGAMFQVFSTVFGSTSVFAVNAAAVLGTIAVMLSNYFGYSRLVFKST